MDGFLIGSMWGIGLLIAFGLWGIEKALLEIRHELKRTATCLDGIEWQLMLMNDKDAEWEGHDEESE